MPLTLVREDVLWALAEKLKAKGSRAHALALKEFLSEFFNSFDLTNNIR